MSSGQTPNRCVLNLIPSPLGCLEGGAWDDVEGVGTEGGAGDDVEGVGIEGGTGGVGCNDSDQVIFVHEMSTLTFWHRIAM